MRPVFIALLCLFILAVAACGGEEAIIDPIEGTPAEEPIDEETPEEAPPQPEDILIEERSGLRLCSPGSRNADFCTTIYDPVCAELNNGERRVYSNTCTACMDANVRGYAPGECVVSETSCPSGQERYMSQTGPACVKSYGRVEIGLLYACQKEGDCADKETCGYARYTTKGEEIPAYNNELDVNGLPGNMLRCLPEDYAAFLLHTSGLEKVDRNGKLQVVIA